MVQGVIEDASIQIKPSKDLCKYIKSLKKCDDMPIGIAIANGKSTTEKIKRSSKDFELLLTNEDKKFIDSLEIPTVDISKTEDEVTISDKDNLLNLEDIHWLHSYIVEQNKTAETKIYLHEIFKGSQIVLPKNKEVERNPILEERCQKLKAQQANLVYKQMTKNVDSVRQKFPEDTIAFQMKQINRHLIAVGQFVVSVLAGFAFGFIGIELMIGNLDFGFRLLLGIICALIIALAELYFLAKKLNEDLEYEFNADAIIKSKQKIE